VDFDDDFFDALAELYVCRRARAGQTGQMWAELAAGAALDATPDAD